MGHLDTSETIRASVWIRPTGEALDRIFKVTRRLSLRKEGPEVPPHLTLLSGIETTRADAGLKLKRLAMRLAPFTVRLGKIDWKADYFRCLYVAAERSRDLVAAQRAAHEVFEMNPPAPFKPRVSLYYGTLDDETEREIAEATGGSLDVEFRASAVQLVNAAPGIPVSQWTTLAEWKLAAAEALHSA
jgi:2'-5' RNA ligase